MMAVNSIAFSDGYHRLAIPFQNFIITCVFSVNSSSRPAQSLCQQSIDERFSEGGLGGGILQHRATGALLRPCLCC